MIEIQRIRDHSEEIIRQLALRNQSYEAQIHSALSLDASRRNVLKTLEDLRARQNTLAREIGDLFKKGKTEEAELRKRETADLKKQSRDLEERLEADDKELYLILTQIPNVPHPTVAPGRDDADNVCVHDWTGPMPEDALMKAPHWDLCKKYNLIDWELGVKITGAGFPIYRGKGAALQRGLVRFFLERAIAAGYEEIIPPFLVNEASGFGTGQLPDKDAQMYHTDRDHLYLIPTAEVPVTNIYRDVILSENDLPVKNCAHSPCFRREAGSYGKDVRGLNRVHQFEKVEIVQITTPADSYQALDNMVNHVKGLLAELGLPFRIVRLCGGDLGFASALTFDFEVWSAAQKKWLEVSSVSNFETFQANRLKLRYKDGSGKTALAHTLNGSALALPRIMAALLENYQTPQGIMLPKVLHSYTGFEIIS
jgi:seryl-tRNA synthetase